MASNLMTVNSSIKVINSMTNYLKKSLLTLNKFDKQLNKSVNSTKAMNRTREQVLKVNSAFTSMNSILTSNIDRFQDLEKHLDSLSNKIRTVIQIQSEPKSNTLGSEKPAFMSMMLARMSAIEGKTNDASKFSATAPSSPQVSAGTGSSLANAGKDILGRLTGQLNSLYDKPFKTILQMSIEGALNEDVIKSIMTKQMGNGAEVEALFASIKSNAVNYGMDQGGAVRGVMSMRSMTENHDQLDKLSELSLRMAALDPGGRGTEYAANAVKSAYMGDTSTLTKQFNVKQSTIDSMDLKTSASPEKMDGFIAAFDEILEQSAMGEEAINRMLSSPAKQAEILSQNINAAFAGAGTGAITLLVPMLQQLNAAFKSEGFLIFFEAVSIGLAALAQGLIFVMQIAGGLGDLLVASLPVVGPIVLGIVAAFWAYNAVLKAVSIATAIYSGLMTAYRFIVMVATVVQLGLSAAMWANPISVIIGLVVGLIVAFLGLIVALKPVRDFVADVFRTLGDVMAKAVGFYIDLWTGFINGFIEIINLFLEGVDQVVGTIGKFVGIEVGVKLQLDSVDSSKFKAGIQDGIKNTFNAVGDFTENFDVDFIKKSVGLDNLTKMAGDKDKMTASKDSTAFTIPNVGSASNIDRVGEVGKINDSVEISSEDLKTMRELAEMKNIQNFVSLQPTVSVQTGDINNGYDIDTIIGRIERSLNDEIASSAEGVYNR
ncbi:hypothetical protein AB4Z45_18645 [Paenibacillus sp. MCAF9]|uniref:hypothetical protein n=1 Tax=Paenibacillus sp. MCAF9 TaxID=3233046 RepID=UPI003F9D0EEB